MTSIKKSTDPTKDPEFQKVVRRFLKTPPKPHKPKKGKPKSEKTAGQSSSR